MLGFTSDDTTGLEYVVFFDNKTRKFIKAVSGINKTDQEEEDELTEPTLTTKMTALIDHYEVMPTFDGDQDFIVMECQAGDDWITRFEERDEIIKLTGDMGFSFF